MSQIYANPRASQTPQPEISAHQRAIAEAERSAPDSRRPLIALEVDLHRRRENALAVGLYRVFEWTAALAGLILSLPILLIEAAVIRLESPGPVLFFQWRCGRSRIVRGSELTGRTDIAPPSGRFEADKYYYVPTLFRFVKFRTMYHDARERFPELYRYQYVSHDEFRAQFWKSKDDPRVTRVGRWLRRSTLDELPNLWNVLTGSIGLVGPRPEAQYYLPYYSAEEMMKFSVRPGITGLQVVKGRSNITIGETIDWDLKYVRERSIALDLKILLITAWLIITRHGAY